MTITVPAIPTPVPTSTDPTNFDARADALLAALPGFVEGQNLQNVENNTINSNVNNKAIDTAADAVATGQDRTQTALDRAAAAASYDAFDDRYLGAKSAAPTVDNDGQTLLVGAIYFDTVIGSGSWCAWNGSAWITAPVANASAVVNTPAGNIGAGTVQAAINELDAEKAALTGAAFTGHLSYTLSLTGGTGVVNLGSGQFYKDASGNVGIGTSTPGSKLEVTGTLNAVALGTTLAYGVSGEVYSAFRFNNSSFAGGNSEIRNIVNGLSSTGSALSFLTTQTGSGPLTERVRIDSSGNLLVGTTVAGGQLTVKATGVTAPASFQVFSDGNTGISLKNSAGGVAGSVVVNTSTVAYNTSSDYRLKNIIAPMTGALDKVALLKPCTYKWIVDGSDGQGFIAHELAEVEPGCVTGEKDATESRTVETAPAIPAEFDAEGVETSPAVAAVTEEQVFLKYQGIDTSFLVATLAAAIQELKAIVDAQAVKIAALEAK